MKYIETETQRDREGGDISFMSETQRDRERGEPAEDTFLSEFFS